MADWTDIDGELELWDQPATLWWRDDDASVFTPQLAPLLALSARYNVPLHLAVIPGNLEDSVAELLSKEDQNRIRILQHGFDHSSHAVEGQKKIELGGSQSLSTIVNKLEQGRNELRQKFQHQYLDILVPPWNRLEERVEAALPDIGYQMLSVLGPRKSDRPLPQTNVHIDIMDWKTHSFRGEAAVLDALLIHLQQRRLQQVDSSEPTGLMTHHQVHDDDCWRFLENFFSRSATHPVMQWVTGQALFQTAVQ